MIVSNAQNTPAINQSEAIRRQQEAERAIRETRDQNSEQAPLITPDEAFDIGPQYLLKARERLRWFSLDLDSHLSWTDNMLFNERDGLPTVRSTLLASTAQFAVSPWEGPLGEGRIRPRAGYRHLWMNYALLGPKEDPNTGFPKSDNDFDGATAFTDMSLSLANWQLQAGFDWQRLLSHQPEYTAYTEFYRSYSPRWSLGRIFAVSQKHAIVSSYMGALHFTHVDPTPGLNDGNRNDRVEHNLILGWAWIPLSKLYVQPLYRFQLASYTSQNRTDQVHNTSLSANYLFTSWLFARASAGYELRESNDPLTPDYRKWDIGFSLGASFRF